jgi:peptidoglycan/LPS O-acetylase OafA/YrhL
LRYRAEIDGLRALAVGSVILFHAGFTVFEGGFVGVDVFFVISGYLITSILISEFEDDRFRLANFYERRARRILPALFVVMAACLPFAWMWLMPGHMQQFALSLASVSVFSSNIQFWRESGYFDTAADLKPLLHTWSLAVEEQYYILFPLFLILAWPLGRRRVFWLLFSGAAASLAMAQWGSHHKPEAAFYLLPARGWELLIGSLSACYLFTRDREPNRLLEQLGSLAGMALLLYSIIVFNSHTPFPGLYALAPTVGTALIIIFANGETIVNRALRNRFLVGLGLISYSAYLWHWPLFVFAKYRSLTAPPAYLMSLLCVVTLMLAYLSWRFIEQPFRQKQRISRRVILSMAAPIAASFFMLGASGYIEQGFPFRFSPDVLSLAQSGTDKNPRQDECVSDIHKYLSPKDACGIGNPDHIVGVLWGDSHSDALAVALGDALSKSGLGMKHMWYASCPPIPGLHDAAQPARECERYTKDVLQRIENDNSIKAVVLAARWTLYLEGTFFNNGEGGNESTVPAVIDAVEYKDGPGPEAGRKDRVRRLYIDGVRKLLATGKNIILVYPIPEVGWDAPSYAAKRVWFAGAHTPLTTSYAAFLSRNKDAIAALDSIGDYPNLERIYPHKALCDTVVKNRCIVTLGARSLYYDDNHLSNYGATFVVGNNMKAMQLPIAEQSKRMESIRNK